MGHTKTSERKRDHIDLAFQSAVRGEDKRFYYEPLFSGHPKELDLSVEFLGKRMGAPIWVSSMTGGTQEANTININLAKACKEFGLGMGLGSCRIILDSDEHLADFQLRKYIGDAPFYANLGVAQLEELFARGNSQKITELVNRTETDGLIVHVNPLQEWLQPEGDRFEHPPLDTIQRVLDLDLKVIVKEVGQGFGPRSLEALAKLPLAAIEFGAHGGTNFSKLEMHRSSAKEQEIYGNIATWGHDAGEMVEFYNLLGRTDIDVIISGGVRTFLDGYYLKEKINTNAVYGQASAFLRYARADYEQLADFVRLQIEGLKLAETYLSVRK